MKYVLRLCEKSDNTTTRFNSKTSEKTRHLLVLKYCENDLEKGVNALNKIKSSKTDHPKSTDKSDSSTGSGTSDQQVVEFSNSGEIARKELIENFQDFCSIDMDFADSTIERHTVVVRDFLDYFDGGTSLTREKIRKYLKDRKKKDATETYAN